MTLEEINDLNLELLKGIDKLFPFQGDNFDKSILALGLFEACKEIGFEKLPPKIVHLWLLTVTEYYLKEETDGN